MKEITITFNNGTTKLFKENTSILEISLYYQKFMPNPILGARLNNEIATMNTKVLKDCKIDFIDICDAYGYRMYQAALKFIYEVAVKEVFKTAEVRFLHSVPKGIMSEIVYTSNIVKDDLTRIKEKMAEIISNNLIIEKYNVLKKDAINYFQKVKMPEKALNIHNTNNKVVDFYKLKNIYNYYYTEMPYSTGNINKFDLVYLGKNRVVIVYPSARTKGLVPEYVHYDNIIDNFLENQKWLELMKVEYLPKLNALVSNNKIEELIKSNELEFNDSISKVAREIIKDDKIKMVLISGPSSSGKTTTNNRLSSYLNSLGYQTIAISVDDYYKDNDVFTKEKVPNREVIEAIDTELLNKDINDLLNGMEIHLPSYDFLSDRKTRRLESVKMSEKTILLVEGLHCLNDELTKDIPNECKYKIYLSPFIPLGIDRHNYVSTVDLRLLRRIVRDNRCRGTNVLDTIKMWQEVRDGEEKHIFPYIHQANTVINTSYVFEIGVLKVFVEPLLYSVGLDSPFYEEARRLINFLQGFYPIPSEYVSKDSILREFIG